jgi:HAE1 family hydrophobic/amphiphilic exporter-1
MPETNSSLEERREQQSGRGLKIASFSIRHPVTVWMTFLCFIVLGGVAILKIPLVLAPDISFPFINVMVPYPNATPGQIEESLARPIEEALATVPHVRRMTSRSGDDSLWVGLGFDWGQDVDWLRAEVREKLDQIRIELPADTDRILVRNWSTNDEPILDGQLASGFDLASSYDLLDRKIKKPLERVPGVAEVEIYGAQPKVVDIYFRLDDLRRYRVDIGSLVSRLDQANLNVALGRVEDGRQRYSAITRGTIESLEQIYNFPVNDRGIRMRQIADVYFNDPIRNNGRHLNGVRAVGFSVRKTSQANTVDTVNQVLAKIDEIKQDPALEGINPLIWFNQGTEITKAISGLVEAGTIGAVLAVAVLYLFLRRLGATLAIGFAIPFSIIATIGFLYILGKTLNVLTMMGLMLACGMLVDNAVVVLESIYQHLEKGRDRITAAKIGTQEVTVAVIAATLSSVIIFVPLVFGKTTSFSIWLSGAGTSIMIALLCSLFISLTLIPLGVARMIKLDVTRKPLVERLLASWRRGRTPKRTLTARYLFCVQWTLRHRYVVGLLIVPLLVGVSVWKMKGLPDNSAEAQDLQSLVVQYEFSENYHYAKIERQYVNPVEKYLLSNKDKFKIKDVFSWYGNNEAMTRVYFDKERVTLEELKEIRPKIADGIPKIPGADISMGRQEGAESQNWISADLYGEDSSTLSELAREVKARLRNKPGFSEIYTDAERGKEEVRIRLDRARARKYGISAQQMASVLSIVVRGQQLRGYRTQEGEVEIWTRLRPDDRSDLEDLKQLVIGAGPQGQEIQLAQVAQLDIVKTPGVIRREDRRAFTWIEINYSGEKKDDGKKILSEVLDGMNYPPGYGWSYGFWTQRQEEEDKAFLFNILLALFMVYFVMAALFESVVHPFAIMISLPFALVGVVWTLYLTGTPFNMMAQIGLMVLVGVVVNNGIVLLDHVNNLRVIGYSREEAIKEGCRERLRPIVMTASTTIVGLIPLAVGTSGIFELRYFPLARTVMGGLLMSTVLSLIVLPVYYVFFDDLAEWAKRLWRLSDPAVVPASSPSSVPVEPVQETP